MDLYVYMLARMGEQGKRGKRQNDEKIVQRKWGPKQGGSNGERWVTYKEGSGLLKVEEIRYKGRHPLLQFHPHPLIDFTRPLIEEDVAALVL